MYMGNIFGKIRPYLSIISDLKHSLSAYTYVQYTNSTKTRTFNMLLQEQNVKKKCSVLKGEFTKN